MLADIVLPTGIKYLGFPADVEFTLVYIYLGSDADICEFLVFFCLIGILEIPEHTVLVNYTLNHKLTVVIL